MLIYIYFFLFFCQLNEGDGLTLSDVQGNKIQLENKVLFDGYFGICHTFGVLSEQYLIVTVLVDYTYLFVCCFTFFFAQSTVKRGMPLMYL